MQIRKGMLKFYLYIFFIYITFHTVSFEDSVTRKKYSVHTILQVRVKPGSYSKGPQTMGAKEEIDGLFSNDEIEWFTNREGVHYIFGILVYMKMVD